MHKRLILIVGVVAVICGFSGSALAANDINNQAVVQGYSADSSLQLGLIVGLKGKPAKVSALDQNNAQYMQGVVVSPADAPVTLSPSTKTGKHAYVATFGRYDTLVSTQNGTIGAGDYIAISSINGVGMKADGTSKLVLGKAAANFDGIGNVESTSVLKNSQGKKITVAIGRIPVDIKIAKNPLKQTVTNYVPGFLQSLTTNVASKPVSAPRIYLGLVTLIATAFIAGSVLYSGVRSTMVAIGRNPLARKPIIRGLLQVMLVSVIVFIIGLFAVYLLLKL